MGFNEKVHAYIAAKYYVHLTEKFGERGKRAFLHGTRYYAEQRGRRMAQRAIRDGRVLDYGTYLEYGEWVSTEEVKAAGEANQSERISISPDYETHIFRCPWHLQFKEMGLVDGGDLYCSDLDRSICRGFNPEIQYDVLQTLHKSDYCVHIIRNVNFHDGEKHPKKMEYVKSFAYHCAHSYWAYAECSEAIFGAEGKAVAEQVLADLAQDYEQAMADEIESYRNTNFNVCD